VTKSLGIDRSLTRRLIHDPALPILETVSVRGDTNAVITLIGEIDISSADQVRMAVGECLREPQPLSLQIDVSALTFCDCAGIRVLHWARNRALAEQIPIFRISGADARLRRVFALARADELLDACEATPRVID